MYTGEFKNGARYKTCHGEGLITYIGALNGIHYYLDADGDMDEWSDEILRNFVTEEVKTPKTITRYANIIRYGDEDSLVFCENKYQADNGDYYDKDKRISCVKVTITYTEGQFDE